MTILQAKELRKHGGSARFSKEHGYFLPLAAPRPKCEIYESFKTQRKEGSENYRARGWKPSDLGLTEEDFPRLSECQSALQEVIGGKIFLRHKDMFLGRTKGVPILYTYIPPLFVHSPIKYIDK